MTCHIKDNAFNKLQETHNATDTTIAGVIFEYESKLEIIISINESVHGTPQTNKNVCSWPLCLILNHKF